MCTSTDPPSTGEERIPVQKVIKIDLTKKTSHTAPAPAPTETAVQMHPKGAVQNTHKTIENKRANHSHRDAHPGEVHGRDRLRQKQYAWIATIVLTLLLLVIVAVSAVFAKHNESNDIQTTSTSQPPISASPNGISTTTTTMTVPTGMTTTDDNQATIPSTISITTSSASSTVEVPITTWLSRGLDLDIAGKALAMSFDGSILAVGVPQDKEKGDYAGNVRIFKWNKTQTNGDDLDKSYTQVNHKSMVRFLTHHLEVLSR